MTSPGGLQGYRAVCLLLHAALAAVVLTWLRGLGPPFVEGGFDVAVAGTLLLLPVVVVLTARARHAGVPRAWRVVGLTGALPALLLPAALLLAGSVPAPGQDAFACGSLLDSGSYQPRDDLVREVCGPARAARSRSAAGAAVLGLGVTAGLATTALRRSPR